LQYQVNDAHRVEFNGNYIRNKGNGKQSNNGYTNATSEDVTEQYQVGIKHIWEMQTALADSLTWQLDWLSKEENGITDRV
ncbi:hypothetical protein OFC49_40930, partial [Escherichia coli]|nr:hypothetical protein [Escherichia coli]